jgi:hypothetical protein
MSQQEMDARITALRRLDAALTTGCSLDDLMNRFRTALRRLDAALTQLDHSGTLDDATLAQIVALTENAANIAQSNAAQLVPGHFLPLLQEPRQGLVTEATAPMHPRLLSSGQILANASPLNQASA